MFKVYKYQFQDNIFFGRKENSVRKVYERISNHRYNVLCPYKIKQFYWNTTFINYPYVSLFYVFSKSFSKSWVIVYYMDFKVYHI